MELNLGVLAKSTCVMENEHVEFIDGMADKTILTLTPDIKSGDFGVILEAPDRDATRYLYKLDTTYRLENLKTLAFITSLNTAIEAIGYSVVCIGLYVDNESRVSVGDFHFYGCSKDGNLNVVYLGE